MEVKQVIVVRTDLNMRKGKLAAQVAHASLKVILDMMDKRIEHDGYWGGDYVYRELSCNKNSDLEKWLDGSFTKIVVGCNSEEELFSIYHMAKQQKIPCSIIKDAGRTEFDGVPTNTCVAIGPSKSIDVDEITGGLKLL